MAQFRVRVSDGFDSAYFIGTNTVSINDLPPTLQLSSSDTALGNELKLEVVRGSTLSLHANGYDPETGAIQDVKSYLWTVIGQDGNPLYEEVGQIFSNPLYQEAAKIEVQVTDPAGQTTIAVIQLQIIEPEFTSEEAFKQFSAAIDEIFDPVKTSSSDGTFSGCRNC